MQIEERFFEVFASDRDKFIQKWLVSWDYQEKRKKRKHAYQEAIADDFFSFNGKADLVKWMNWFEKDYPDYLPETLTQPLVQKSLANDQKIFRDLGLQSDWVNYEKRIGLNNAHDSLFPQLYPVPDYAENRVVLDFGAGYGRQANLWARENSVYIGMDAIVNSYCLQNLYYSSLGQPFTEYLDDPSAFKVDVQKSGIYHLPTWRTDLIPDNSVDLVMCVQVLPELNSKLVKHMISQFQRMLKPGGMLYLRDHGHTWKPAGSINVDNHLKKTGFVLEFVPHLRNDIDLHGLVRIWRKPNPDVVNSWKRTRKEKKRQFIENMDTLLGGGLTKLKRKIKG